MCFTQDINGRPLMTSNIILTLFGQIGISISLISRNKNSKETGCLNKQALLTKGLQMLHASLHHFRSAACLWKGAGSPGAPYSKTVDKNHSLASPSASLKKKIL